jgi:hypothetical protein
MRRNKHIKVNVAKWKTAVTDLPEFIDLFPQALLEKTSEVPHCFLRKDRLSLVISEEFTNLQYPTF